MSLPSHRNGQQTFSVGPTQTSSPSRREVDHAGNDPTSTTPQNFYLALRDFVGHSQSELSVRKGDNLHIIDRTNNGKFHSLQP